MVILVQPCTCLLIKIGFRKLFHDNFQAILSVLNCALRNLKRKMEEIMECIICRSIPSEGQMRQCRNGHLACQRCMGNEALTTCGVCREPLGSKRIRNVAVEQLMDAVDLEVSCKHQNCMFRDAKNAVKTHERTCDKRIVQCPDPFCPEMIPLKSLLHHMKVGNPTRDFRQWEPTVGTITSTGEMTPEIFHGNTDLEYHCRVHRFQGEIFMSAFHRTNGIWYAYTYIFGDIEKAKKFRVKISIGNENGASMRAQGQVFPIDADKAQILDATSGLLSFAQVGMAKQFFMDHNHEVAGQSIPRKRFHFVFRIESKGSAPAQHGPMLMY